MIDETDIFARFHSAFEVQPPPGAAQRLRSALLERHGGSPVDGYGGTPHRTRRRTDLPSSLRISLRVAAGLLLFAIAISTTALFLITHRTATYVVPANPSSSPSLHALAGSGGGMVSLTTGWQLGAGFAYRTTDGGASWTDVTPRPYPVPNGLQASYFLDATHAWILPDRTVDGGKTWQEGESINLPSGQVGYSPSLYFHDPDNGWLLVNRAEPTSGADPGDLLFATRDGGLHWSGLATSPASTAAGCRWLAVAFVSLADGWISQTCGVPGMLLTTHDGGTTWSPQQLPTGGRLPVALDDDHAVIFSPYELLVTSDAGRTWAIRRMPAGVIQSVHFINPTHGWAALQSDLQGALQLYRTDDSGVTWSRVATKLPSDVRATYNDLNGTQFSDNVIVDVYFVDLRNGFAVRGGVFTLPGTCASKYPTKPLPCEAFEQLLKTSDGGVTWTVVGYMPG